MTRSVALAFSLCGCVLLLPLAAQDDPQSVPTRVRTWLRDDNVPMPGVSVRILMGSPEQATFVRDEWLVAGDRDLAQHLGARIVRSDPDASFVLPMPDGQPNFRLVAAPPFRSHDLERAPDGDGWVLRVERLEQFRVKVVDAKDQALANFPLVLTGGHHRHGVAWTDDSGHAMFGVEPRVTVRMTVAPWGWNGPTDMFPTVASQLPKETVLLRVPAHGTARVRTLQNGVAKRTTIHDAELTHPVRTHLAQHEAHAPLHGVEFALVPLGARVAGRVRTDNGTFTFDGDGPVEHREIVYLDVETDPARPRVALTIASPKVSIEHGMLTRVYVRVVTDQGHFGEFAEADEHGRVETRFLQQRIRGQRIVRVDVDAEVWNSRRSRRWPAAASVPMDRAVTDTRIELGDFTLEQQEPLLRGRVVDRDGKPVPEARVTVRPEPERFAWMAQSVACNGSGHFEVNGPLPRGDAGEVLTTSAWAEIGRDRDVVSSAVTAGLRHGAEIDIVLAPPSRGLVALAVPKCDGTVRDLLEFTWVPVDRERLVLDRAQTNWSNQPDGACMLGPLPSGRGELFVGLRHGRPLKRLATIVVEGDGTVQPEPLQRVDLADVIVVRRLRVVDEQGVPLPNQVVEYGVAGRTHQLGSSGDETGFVTVAVARQRQEIEVRIGSDGKEPAVLDDVAGLADGADVVLGPRRQIRVAVRGLPAGLPKDRVFVWLRPVQRDNLADAVQAPIAAGGEAIVPRPRPGDYRLQVRVAIANSRGSLAIKGIWQAAEPIVVAEGNECFECTIDDAALERLRTELAK